MFAWAALNEGGFGKCNVCISRRGLGVRLERVRLQVWLSYAPERRLTWSNQKTTRKTVR